MQLDKSLFRSKIARRIFWMFVACALLPIAGLYALSFSQVTNQLHEQNYKRLKQTVKVHGLSLYERLLFLRSEMQVVAFFSKKDRNERGVTSEINFGEEFKYHFKALFMYDEKKGYRSFFGQIKNPPKPTPVQIQHIKGGETAILTFRRWNASPRIFMLNQVISNEPEFGFLFGEINPDYLWGADHRNALPPDIDVCVLDASDNILFSSFGNPKGISMQLVSMKVHSGSDVFKIVHENKRYMASRWRMFLKPVFLVPNWTVLLMHSESDVLAPMDQFKKMFPLVGFLSLGAVLLLSINYIRKSLVPLELLKAGTRRIARQDFDCRVNVKSHDEFEELAQAFNDMASRLSRQFKTLVTKAEIDRAILSALDTEKIVKTVITRMRDGFSCDAVSISLIDSAKDEKSRIYTGSGNPPGDISEEPVEIPACDLQRFRENTAPLIITDHKKNPPTYLSTLVSSGMKSFLVLPVYLEDKLAAIIALGQLKPDKHSEEEFDLARQMANQVAVALSNSKLIEELNRLNWGTLKALARAVDAKSPWTAGHSERVTRMALKIGKAMRLEAKHFENLHRAALLHDIGKLGVPVSILDKPGTLSDEEFRIINSHPQIGSRILEPIKVYEEVIPIVLQHHERFDGKGYPNGLGGEAISLGARILAVADVYDSLISDRPYRKGLPPERVIELIRKEAGHQFDPKVVAVFLNIIEQQESKAA